ncbi:MAG: hypothetical protein QOD42_63 [Sphingomonadales bacterium]|jgi:hypothetical protein|nr:hypothetical protein [Sphingomonadales bacterium]
MTIRIRPHIHADVILADVEANGSPISDIRAQAVMVEAFAVGPCVSVNLRVPGDVPGFVWRPVNGTIEVAPWRAVHSEVAI